MVIHSGADEDKGFRDRTRLLMGQEGVERLQMARIVVLGLGGVGSYALEALARAGIGEFWLIDGDVIEVSNINRQLLALRSTLGRAKVDVARERVADINPLAVVRCGYEKYTAEHAYDFSGWDYVVDAIDDLQAKAVLAQRCLSAGVPLIASMGTGWRLQGGAFHVCDVSESRGDPLARQYRRLLRKLGVTEGIKVVVSEDPPLPRVRRMPEVVLDEGQAECRGETRYELGERQTETGEAQAEAGVKGMPVGSVSFVPPMAGLLMAGEAVRDLLLRNGEN